MQATVGTDASGSSRVQMRKGLLIASAVIAALYWTVAIVGVGPTRVLL